MRPDSTKQIQILPVLPCVVIIPHQSPSLLPVKTTLVQWEQGIGCMVPKIIPVQSRVICFIGPLKQLNK